jgi:hypothetical protein
MNRVHHTAIAITLLASAVLNFSCAREQSDEEHRREKERRAMARLAVAGGEFQGWLENDADRVSPVWMSVAPHANPSGGVSKPTLEVSLRVGLFGGVVLAAEESHFDNGRRLLTASFRRASGSPLELRAERASDGSFSGTLDGPNDDPRPFKMDSVTQQTLPSEEEWTLLLSSRTINSMRDEEDITRGTLQLKRASVAIAAPAQSDLPLFVPIEGSIRWEGSMDTPFAVPSVKYDPLRGTLDLTIRDGARLSINSVSLASDEVTTATLTAPTISLSGNIFNGSNKISQVTLETRPGLQLTSANLIPTPPRYWVGSYKTWSGQQFRAKAIVTSSTVEGINSAEATFPTFHKFNVELRLCLGSTENQALKLTTSYFDQLTREARLESPQGPGVSAPWELFFGSRWDTLTGTGSFSPYNPEKRGTMSLRVWTPNALPSCAEIPAP